MAMWYVPPGWKRFKGLGLEGQIIVPSRIVLIFESSESSINEHQGTSRIICSNLERQGRGCWKGRSSRSVSFLKVFLAAEVFFAFNFFEFSEECVITGYGDMVIAAFLQGDGDSRFWL